MSRIWLVVCAAACCITFSNVAVAQFPAANQFPTANQCPPQYGNAHDKSFKTDYYRNSLWPAPFRAMDTMNVLSVFDQQRDNGWRLNNTIGTSMYDASTHCLTAAGKAHVNWILTKAPQSRRVVFVLQGNSPEETAKRVESTQLAVSEMVPVGPLPQIYLTDREAAGSSGVYQTAVHRAMVSSVPSPRLTSAAGAGAGGAGGGAGAPPPSN